MRTALLSDFCDLTQGGKHGLSGKHFVGVGFPAYGAGGLNGFLPEPEFDRDAVVLSAIGARCGKCFLASGEWVSLANTQVIIPDQAQADVRFLWYQLNDEGRWPRHGLAQPFIRPSDVKSHRVFLPPLDEQRRIAAILDKADALRQKRKRAITLLDSLTQSIFLEMFGDARANPYGWRVARLEEVAKFFAGNSLPTGEAYTGQPDGYLMLKVSDMNAPGNEEVIKSSALWSATPGSKAGTCPAGSIVFPKRGGAIATNKKRTSSRPAILDPNVMAVAADPECLNSDYLYHWLQGFNLTDISSGSSVPQLNKRDLAPLEIVVPPLEKQGEFSERKTALKDAKAAATASSMKAESLFTSLLQRAFSGQL